MRALALAGCAAAVPCTAPTPAAASTQHLTVRAAGVSLSLRLEAAATARGTTVTVRGPARIRSRSIRLVALPCPDTRCRRPGRPAVRDLRRGRYALHARLLTRPAALIRVDLRAGRRVLARVLLRAPSSARGAPAAGSPTGAAAAADAGSPAAVTPPISLAVDASPPLTPSYDPAVTDYTVACEPAGHVDVMGTVPPGQRLSIDGDPAGSGSVERDVALHDGQAFSFAVEDTGGTHTHEVRCVPAGFPTWTVQRDGPPDVQWMVFTSMHGDARYVIVADEHGVPVWWQRVVAGGLLDAKFLPDGTIVWGRSTGRSFVQGAFDHYRLDGTPLGTLTTAGIGADTHDIQLLPDGNYLMLAYVPRRHVDLSSLGGPADATVLDGEIQEVTPAGDLVWSWNTADHIPLAETASWGLANTEAVYEGAPAYDLVHLNSIEQTGEEILLSARHLDAVYRIRRSDGGIDFKLGGTTRPESLDFVGDALGGASFGGQHDARMLADGTLTLHDNGTFRGRPPRALRYRLDTGARTATLLEQIGDARVSGSGCCGSARRLPGGHWLMSWGGSRTITELTAAGAPVLTLTLGESFSYRAQPASSSVVDRSALRAGMDAMHPR